MRFLGTTILRSGRVAEPAGSSRLDRRYAKSGQYLAAARIDDPRAVIDHKLYWATASSVDEARYLTAVLNSPVLTKLIAPLQSRGEHNPRDFDKQVWRLPIPIYEPTNERHRELVPLAARAEEVAAATDVSGISTFQAQRRRVRQALEENGVGQEMDERVVDLVAVPHTKPPSETNWPGCRSSTSPSSSTQAARAARANERRAWLDASAGLMMSARYGRT